KSPAGGGHGSDHDDVGADIGSPWGIEGDAATARGRREQSVGSEQDNTCRVGLLGFGKIRAITGGSDDRILGNGEGAAIMYRGKRGGRAIERIEGRAVRISGTNAQRGRRREGGGD